MSNFLQVIFSMWSVFFYIVQINAINDTCIFSLSFPFLIGFEVNFGILFCFIQRIVDISIDLSCDMPF